MTHSLRQGRVRVTGNSESHNGVRYPGEQPAIMDRALWARVQQLNLEARRGLRHGKVNALLSDLLYCAQCGEPMRSSYTARQGRRHLYYVCRNRNADPTCKQKPVASVDIERLLIEQLEPMLGPHPDRIALQHSLERITDDRRISVCGAAMKSRATGGKRNAQL
jgi:hypothetical protein